MEETDEDEEDIKKTKNELKKMWSTKEGGKKERIEEEKDEGATEEAEDEEGTEERGERRWRRRRLNKIQKRKKIIIERKNQ